MWWNNFFQWETSSLRLFFYFRYAPQITKLPLFEHETVRFPCPYLVIKQNISTGYHSAFYHPRNLFQDEAAQRFVDPSLKSSEHRPINVFVNFYSGNTHWHSSIFVLKFITPLSLEIYLPDPEYKLKVPRSNFFPQPKVCSHCESMLQKRTSLWCCNILLLGRCCCRCI